MSEQAVAAQPVSRVLAGDHLLMAGIFAVLIPLRVAQVSHLRWLSVDGGYYTEVARNVRDGNGLATMESLYHFGYPSFPFPTTVYPLWPIVLGLCARVGDLEWLAHWLPLALSFAAVGAAYGFGRRLWPEPLAPGVVPGLHAGHVFALGLSVQTEWIDNTGLPYTEALGWLLLLLFLWRWTIKGAELGPAWAVETGLWLAALYFARFQFLVVPIAAGCAWAARILTGPNRAKVAAHAALALGAAGVPILAWYVRLTGFVSHPGLGSLLRFDQNQFGDTLQPLEVLVPTHGLWDLLVDRAGGVIVAWTPGVGPSYQSAYHTLHWALPLAIPFAAWALGSSVRREGWRGIWSWLRSDEAATWLFLAAFAFGSLLSIHLVHKVFAGSWYFARRQGLMCAVAFLVPLAWLLRRPVGPAWGLGWLVLLSSLAMGGKVLGTEATKTGGELRERDRYHELVGWLEREAAAHPGGPEGVVVAMDAFLLQRIGWRTERVGYHWLAGRSSFEDLETMTDQLGARYVVFRPQARTGFEIFQVDQCRLLRDYRKLPDEPSGMLIFERIGRDPSEEPVWDGAPQVSTPGDCIASAFLARQKHQPRDDEPDDAP